MTRHTSIKFCGLTRVVDVESAVDLGVDYIGLVFADGSPRCVSLEHARVLAGAARSRPGPAKVVALVRNASRACIDEIIAAIDPDLLQFHGRESETSCVAVGRPYWKAIGMAGDVAITSGLYASAAALLLDAHESGGAGGTGERFDWSRWPRLDRPLVLAGGLDPDNVAAAIRATRPYAVDVSSGIESSPGQKDTGRMRAFVEAVSQLDREIAQR